MQRGPDLEALVGVNVLVVDENAEARDVLEAVLAYCGAAVALAASARDALDLFQRMPADVIVASTGLHDGGASRLVRELPARVPVVALGGREDAERARRDGFEAHVRTPVDPWELCRVVAALARKG